MVLNALGGANGSPVDAEIPVANVLDVTKESHRLTMRILHMIALRSSAAASNGTRKEYSIPLVSL